MDKYLRTIDMTEHPENYTDREIREMLDDAETRELYEILCDADSAMKPVTHISAEDIERAWQRVRNEKKKGALQEPVHVLRIFGRRVAAVAMFAVISMAALAIGVGLIMARHSTAEPPAPSEDAVRIANVECSACDTITERTDTLTDTTQIVFENEPLGTILKEMSEYYGLKLEADNKPLLSIRLFYRWNRNNQIEEVVRQLNNFEKINLIVSDGTLTLK